MSYQSNENSYLGRGPQQRSDPDRSRSSERRSSLGVALPQRGASQTAPMQWVEGSDFLGSNIFSHGSRTDSSTDLTNLPTAAQPNVTEFMEGSIREHINNESGIIEVSNGSDVNSYTNVFFHASVVYISDPTGNPYGHPVRLPCGLSLEKAMDIGTGVHFSVLPVDSRWVKYQATAVWPSIARAPISAAVEMLIDNSVYLKNFHSKVNTNIVTATIHGLNGSAEAIVAEVKDYEYGIIQIQFNKEDRLFSLFHRDDVYLPDGKRAVAHQYFKDKPLDMIVSLIVFFFHSIIIVHISCRSQWDKK